MGERRLALALLIAGLGCGDGDADREDDGPATSGSVSASGGPGGSSGTPDDDDDDAVGTAGDDDDDDDDDNDDDDDADGTAGDDDDDVDETGGEAANEFCPPTLTDAAQAWREEYDVFFADPASMRTYIETLPTGTGHWGQSYTLRSIVLMYELTGDLAYLHELMWQTEQLRIQAGGDATWPTGVCSNTFNHTTVVIDARFLVPMLRGAWWMVSSRLADDPIPVIDGVDFGGMTYGEYADVIAQLAQDVLAGHEGRIQTIGSESFGPLEGESSEYYTFPGSYSCVAGDVMPFNYANSAGNAYAELWHLTGDEAAREHAERLHAFWWNRTYAYEPSPGSTRSRWWGYRGKTNENFDPDAFPGDSDQRPEDDGHADMSSSFALRVYAFGLEGQNGTRIDQVAMASKRWIDRAVNNGTNPAYYITNGDTDGDWRDIFDHLPMSCVRASILEDLEALAPAHITDDAGNFRRSNLENIAELAFFNEYSTPPACGPSCGDGICSGPEDCVGCPVDCGACPIGPC